MRVLDNKEEALRVVKKCHWLLKPGGKLILTGHGYSFLHNEDYIALGFNVINSFLTCVRNDAYSINVKAWTYTLGDLNQQFYILEKISVKN